VNFHDARLPRTDDMDISGGGAVETFTNTDDAKRWHDAINAFDRALGSGYDYRTGNASCASPLG
jgi:hypothetical protein